MNSTGNDGYRQRIGLKNILSVKLMTLMKLIYIHQDNISFLCPHIASVNTTMLLSSFYFEVQSEVMSHFNFISKWVSEALSERIRTAGM